MSKKRNRSRAAPPHRPNEIRPHFKVGQRVVCVDAKPNPQAGTGADKLLVAGRIYVVRAIDARPGRWKSPGWGVHLVGIRHFYLDDLEWAFHPRRFRPVEERETDITVFREIAAGVTDKRRVPVPAARADTPRGDGS